MNWRFWRLKRRRQEAGPERREFRIPYMMGADVEPQSGDYLHLQLAVKAVWWQRMRRRAEVLALDEVFKAVQRGAAPEWMRGFLRGVVWAHELFEAWGRLGAAGEEEARVDRREMTPILEDTDGEGGE
jgi:hypothetical protein